MLLLLVPHYRHEIPWEEVVAEVLLGNVVKAFVVLHSISLRRSINFAQNSGRGGNILYMGQCSALEGGEQDGRVVHNSPYARLVLKTELAMLHVPQ